MRLVRRIAALRDDLRPLRRGGARIGLVPTMGYLHAGHMALVDRARGQCDVVVVSIFVNPAQFGPNEDLAAYPRDLDRDLALSQAHGADFVFAPAVAEMYPRPIETHVDAGRLGDILIGAQRPGHFRGVATVVAKLFGIVQPADAYFGEKDFQQLAVVRRMAEDLSMDVRIRAVPTVREPDGLAASSRNVRLSPEDRAAARVVPEALAAAEALVRSGARDAETVRAAVTTRLGAEPRAAVQSVDLCDAADLSPVTALSARPAVLLVTVRFGDVVLIDQRALRIDTGDIP